MAKKSSNKYKENHHHFERQVKPLKPKDRKIRQFTSFPYSKVSSGFPPHSEKKPRSLSCERCYAICTTPVSCKLSDLISYHTFPGLFSTHLLLVLPGTHFLQMTGLTSSTSSGVCSSLPVRPSQTILLKTALPPSQHFLLLLPCFFSIAPIICDTLVTDKFICLKLDINVGSLSVQRLEQCLAHVGTQIFVE